MEFEPKSRIDKNALKAWTFRYLVFSLPGLGFILLLWLIFRNFAWWQPVDWTLPVALGLWFCYFFVFQMVICSLLAYQTWRYHISDDRVDLLHGIFTKRRVVIPIAKIQNVDTEQDPFERMYQLSTVVISNGAGHYHIPALRDQEAMRLRERITELMRKEIRNDS